MSVTDIMAPSEAISPKWTKFPFQVNSEKRWKLKNIQEISVKKSVKSCNYPELNMQISSVFILQKSTWLPSPKKACNPPDRAIIWRAIISNILYLCNNLIAYAVCMVQFFSVLSYSHMVWFKIAR